MLCELTNMCMISDSNGRVLVQMRLPKSNDSWCGLTFPGGHVEPGENIVESTIREIREETGLEIANLESVGYVQWYNPATQLQYLVFLFKTTTFVGEIHSSIEGEIKLMTQEDMLSEQLAPNMEKYLKIFIDSSIHQAFGISGALPTLIDNNGKVANEKNIIC